MSSKHEHNTELTQDQKSALSRKRRRSHLEGHSKPAAEKPSPRDLQNQPTPEEFGNRGMGMAAKE